MAQIGIVTNAKLRLERARADHAPVDIVMRTLRCYSDNDGGFYAAALTYYAFFSLFPIMLFSIAVLGFVLRNNPDLQQELITSGLQNIPLLDSVLSGELDTIRANASRLALASLVLALYSGSGGVGALIHALNRVYHVEVEGNFIQKRVASLKWMGVVAGVGLVAVAPSLIPQLIGARGTLASTIAILGYVSGAVASIGLFLVTYKLLPNLELSWGDVLPGAVIAGAVFEVLKWMGGIYISSGAHGRSATFGAFATAATLLVASYLLAQVTLMSAQVNAVLAERRQTRQSSGGAT